MSSKQIEHPLEEVFDIDVGSTELIVPEERESQLIRSEDYDEKDAEIEEQFQEVYDSAMTAFETQAQEAESIEPKYRARTHEVAAQFLNTALNAAKEKSSLKVHKDKMFIDKAKASGPKTVNQNLIVADRNDVLKKIMEGKDNE